MTLLPSPAERVQLEGYLADARDALHKLLTGRQTIEIATQGDMLKFGRADVDQLKAYIAELEAKLAGRDTKGALGMLWGL